MKSFKKAISVIAALAMLITTLAVAASVPASADDTESQAPVYFTKFTKDNFIGYGEYQRGEDGFESEEGNTNTTQIQEAGSVTYPADGAVDVATKNAQSKGVRLLYKLDDTAKNYFKQLEDEAAAKYEENVQKAKEKAEKQGKKFNIEDVAKVYPSVKCNYFIKEANNEKGLDSDTYVTFAFVLKDGTITDAIFGSGNKYRTREDSIPIRKKIVKNGETSFEAIDLNDIVSVRLEVYHWEKSLKEVIFSGFTVSGTGVLPEREPIKLGEEKTAVAFKFDKDYRRDYEPTPKEIRYSDVENPTGQDGKRDGFNKKGKAGWMKWLCEGASQQYQSAFWFNHDQFDYALALANRKDENGNLIGSGKFLMTFGLESCVDKDGKAVKAEVKVNFDTYSEGYVTLVDQWMNPGETAQFELDVSNIKRGDVQMVVICVQNYWYYDKDGNLAEYPVDGKEVDVTLEDNETSKTIKYGTGVKWIGGVCPQIKVSPITVMEPNQVLTTATHKVTNPTTTKKATQEIEGAGYHFFDFEEACRVASYGNQPETIKYYNDSSKSDPLVIYTGKDDDFYGGFNIKSKYSNMVGKQYQECFTLVTVKATNDQKQEEETKISDDYAKRMRNKMKQGLAYANAPGAPGMLAYKVRVNSCKNGTYKLVNGKGKLTSGSGETCSIQIGMQFLCEDSYDNIQAYKWQNIGKEVQTHYLDVSDITYDKINQVHPMAQNYANVDPDTGNACGIYDIDVDISALYVAGNGAGTPTRTQAATANNSEVEALYALYKQLPGLNESDYQTEADWALLEKFIEACISASPQTMHALNEKGVSTDIIGRLQEIYFGTAGGDDAPPPTGAANAPIAAMCVAVAAGFVFMKFRKK